VAAPSGALVRQEPVWSETEQDVLSALVNLGCKRADAEAAVRKAGAGAASSDFEPLFRKALGMVR